MPAHGNHRRTKMMSKKLTAKVDLLIDEEYQKKQKEELKMWRICLWISPNEICKSLISLTKQVTLVSYVECCLSIELPRS